MPWCGGKWGLRSCFFPLAIQASDPMPNILWVLAPSWTPGLLRREEGENEEARLPHSPPRTCPKTTCLMVFAPRACSTRCSPVASIRLAHETAFCCRSAVFEQARQEDLGRKGPGEWASMWGRGHVQSQCLLHVLQRPKLFTSVCNHLLQIEVKAATYKESTGVC